ncbi:right-handed parallel beta-helix repeat-containing protein [Shimia sp.]|uniref:right-handed parallel beta-helix repeat-containing protein n=1 Tax=Shimia sp. TaxID=1954381 RepID=UPI003298119D
MQALAQNLVEIFATEAHDYGRIHDVVEAGFLASQEGCSVGYNVKPGSVYTIDLQGETFVLDRPLKIRKAQLIHIRNGTLVAGPTFPKGEFLIDVFNGTGLVFQNLFLECSKRANGITLADFFRVRIEDCHIIHQRDYGIYSAPQGNNHELEVMKCHISEYLYWDGHPGKASSYGIIPPFDVDENRQSVGVYLGQADNVVADCNINLCRTGIYCGMRANRIQGNHITGGGSLDLDIFKGIELDNFHKSSAIINNNYIDNCTLWINCDDHPRLNQRNYLHVTSNLFYRGYNHPSDGRTYSHIVVNPLKPGSFLGNVHVTNNLFYNQDENLEAIKPRVLEPIRVHSRTDSETGEHLDLNHAGILNFRMESNQFTNRFPTFVKPMGTTVTKRVEATPDKHLYTVPFKREIPVGILRDAEARISTMSDGQAAQPIVRRLLPHAVEVELPEPFAGTISVTASAISEPVGRFSYIVK